MFTDYTYILIDEILFSDRKGYKPTKYKPLLSERTKDKITEIGAITLLAIGGLVGGYIVRMVSEPVPRCKVPCRVGDRKVYPPLSDRERVIFEGFNNCPDLVQNWINKKPKWEGIEKRYMGDGEQFVGSLCETKEDCEVCSPAAHFLRSGLENCKGVLFFCHYALNYSGLGLHIHGRKIKDEKVEKFGHAVYVYPKNGLFGVNSINKSEYRKEQYETIDDLVHSLDDKLPDNKIYDYYQIITLPNDEETVLYDFDAMKKAKKGEKIYLNQKSIRLKDNILTP